MRRKRKSITDRQRFRILRRDNFQCVYCQATGVKFEIDHLYPHSLGGEDATLNLVTACKKCNRGKSDMLLSDDMLAEIKRCVIERENALQQEEAAKSKERIDREYLRWQQKEERRRERERQHKYNSQEQSKQEQLEQFQVETSMDWEIRRAQVQREILEREERQQQEEICKRELRVTREKERLEYLRQKQEKQEQKIQTAERTIAGKPAVLHIAEHFVYCAFSFILSYICFYASGEMDKELSKTVDVVAFFFLFGLWGLGTLFSCLLWLSGVVFLVSGFANGLYACGLLVYVLFPQQGESEKIALSEEQDKEKHKHGRYEQPDTQLMQKERGERKQEQQCQRELWQEHQRQKQEEKERKREEYQLWKDGLKHENPDMHFFLYVLIPIAVIGIIIAAIFVFFFV